MHQLLKETAVEFPPSPSRSWSLIFYSDEIAPGNVLSSRHIAQAANVLCMICRIWGCRFGGGSMPGLLFLPPDLMRRPKCQVV